MKIVEKAFNEKLEEIIAKVEIQKQVAAIASSDDSPIKAAYVKKKKIERDYELEMFREQETKTVSSITKEQADDLFSTFGSQLKINYKKAELTNKISLSNTVPFINSEFAEYFKLVPGQLVTVAAYTGSGKTTTTVNIVAEAIRAGKRALIISNEESTKDVYDMVACLLEDVDYRDLAFSTVDKLTRKKILNRVSQLIDDKWLMVIDGELSNGGTTKSEYILNLLKLVDGATVKPDIVLVDYLTNIYTTGSTSSDNHYFQLQQFLTQIKNLINTVSFPIIINAQMHSDDKKKGSSIDQKLIMGGLIQQYSTILVEVKTSHETCTSDYIIHKNRKFKRKGGITLRYHRGAMVSTSDDPTPVMSAAEVKGDKITLNLSV